MAVHPGREPLAAPVHPTPAPPHHLRAQGVLSPRAFRSHIERSPRPRRFPNLLSAGNTRTIAAFHIFFKILENTPTK